MSIKISITAEAAQSLPKELIGECLDDLIDDNENCPDGMCPAEVINVDGFPEFLLAYNPLEQSAFVMLTSEENEVLPDGLLSVGEGVRLRGYSAAEYN